MLSLHPRVEPTPNSPETLPRPLRKSLVATWVKVDGKLICRWGEMG